jgi:hypothetical protein
MEPFEQFRAAYPVAKREEGTRARAVFEAALKKAPLATLLAAVEEHKGSEQWEIPRYIPMMTNWLLGERWLQRLTPPAPDPITPMGLSPADQAQRWRSLSPHEQLRRMGYTKPEPPRCPRCGSYSWEYRGGVQQCSDCGK